MRWNIIIICSNGKLTGEKVRKNEKNGGKVRKLWNKLTL